MTETSYQMFDALSFCILLVGSSSFNENNLLTTLVKNGQWSFPECLFFKPDTQKKSQISSSNLTASFMEGSLRIVRNIS